MRALAAAVALSLYQLGGGNLMEALRYAPFGEAPVFVGGVEGRIENAGRVSRNFPLFVEEIGDESTEPYAAAKFCGKPTTMAVYCHMLPCVSKLFVWEKCDSSNSVDRSPINPSLCVDKDFIRPPVFKNPDFDAKCWQNTNILGGELYQESDVGFPHIVFVRPTVVDDIDNFGRQLHPGSGGAFREIDRSDCSISSSLRMSGGVPCILGREASSKQGKPADKGAKDPKAEGAARPIGGLLGRIRSFPLSAQVGVAIFFAFFAGLCQIRAGISLYDRPSGWWVWGGYSFGGLLLLVASTAIFW